MKGLGSHQGGVLPGEAPCVPAHLMVPAELRGPEEKGQTTPIQLLSVRGAALYAVIALYNAA